MPVPRALLVSAVIELWLRHAQEVTMKKLTFVCLAAVFALMPRMASAQEVCQTVGSGTEQICYTGVFPSNPIIIELGQSIRLPPTT